ncbi:MAG: hypothetical protein HY320_00670, partial [Armatimonadetes bacterium]|nr:hypothetical protein [Armatimonadota bacterium]
MKKLLFSTAKGVFLCLASLGVLWASQEKAPAADITAQVSPILKACWKPLPKEELSAAAAGKILARAGKLTLRGNQEFLVCQGPEIRAALQTSTGMLASLDVGGETVM